MEQMPADHWTKSVVEFCRFARANGFSGGLHRSLAALRAVKAVGTGDETLRFALRAVLCSSKTDWDRFDQLFNSFEEISTPCSVVLDAVRAYLISRRMLLMLSAR